MSEKTFRHIFLRKFSPKHYFSLWMPPYTVYHVPYVEHYVSDHWFFFHLKIIIQQLWKAQVLLYSINRSGGISYTGKVISCLFTGYAVKQSTFNINSQKNCQISICLQLTGQQSAVCLLQLNFSNSRSTVASTSINITAIESLFKDVYNHLQPGFHVFIIVAWQVNTSNSSCCIVARQVSTSNNSCSNDNVGMPVKAG